MMSQEWAAEVNTRSMDGVAIQIWREVKNSPYGREVPSFPATLKADRFIKDADNGLLGRKIIVNRCSDGIVSAKDPIVKKLRDQLNALELVEPDKPVSVRYRNSTGR